MVVNEFLPNPTGKDAGAEWIELFNESREPQNLLGWKLKDASGKSFTLRGVLASNEYLLLDSKTTKITLNNDSETIFLFDASGKQVDALGFAVAAPSGKSFIRQANNRGVFTDKPTPGAPNVFENQNAAQNTAHDPTANFALAQSAPSQNTALVINTSSNLAGILIGLTIAAVLAAFFLFVYKKFNLEKEYEV